MSKARVSEIDMTRKLEKVRKSQEIDNPFNFSETRTQAQRLEQERAARKADEYPARINCFLSEEQRDQLDLIVKKLQRGRTTKEERLTINSLMRVAIKVVLAQFKQPPSEAINNEDELLRFVEKRLAEQYRQGK